MAQLNPRLAYLENEIKAAGPADRVVMALDAALRACMRQDGERVARALGVLTDALRFDPAPEVAQGFLRIYEYCGEQAHQGNFKEAARRLLPLREAWDAVRARGPQQA